MASGPGVPDVSDLPAPREDVPVDRRAEVGAVTAPVQSALSAQLVDGRSVQEVTDAVAGLLLEPERARSLGAAGRAWVQRDWRWDVLAERLRSLLAG